MAESVTIIGDATLYLGNCFDVLPTLPRADALITDQPYGIGERMQGGTWGAAARGSRKSHEDRSMTCEQSHKAPLPEETQAERHNRLANEEYEAIGRLYHTRFGRLRPGKDDMLHDSMSEENVRQFSDWIRREALTDAVFRIMALERQLEAAERELGVAAEAEEDSYAIDEANIPKAGRDL